MSASISPGIENPRRAAHTISDSEGEDGEEFVMPPPLSSRLNPQIIASTTQHSSALTATNPFSLTSSAYPKASSLTTGLSFGASTLSITSEPSVFDAEKIKEDTRKLPQSVVIHVKSNVSVKPTTKPPQPTSSSESAPTKARGRKKADPNAQQDAQQAKLMKKLQSEVNKLNKPTDAMKQLVIRIDLALIQNKHFGAQLLRGLQELEGLQIDLCDLTRDSTDRLPRPPSNGVLWLRKVSRVDEMAGQVVTELSSEGEPEVMLIMPGRDLFKMRAMDTPVGPGVVADVKKRAPRKSGPTISFSQFVATFNPVKTYILVLFEMNKHVAKAPLGVPPTPSAAQKSQPLKVSQEEFQEVLLELQLDHSVHPRVCERVDELVTVCVSYTKAVAQKPHKQNRLDSLFSFLDSAHSNGVRLNPRYMEDGEQGSTLDQQSKFGLYGGVQNLWRQQLLQWPGVTQEMADAVIAVYPTYRALYIACRDARIKGDPNPERMFENIEIRRGAGILANTRRLGKEFSRRLYQFMTADDPDFLLE